MAGDAFQSVLQCYGRTAWHAARAMVLACALCAPQPAAAGGKQPLDWTRSTTVDTQVAGSNDTANPMCGQISTNISKRVASIKSLRASYNQSATAPPSSVKSALEDMFGTRQPDAKMLDIERQIKLERKAADDLNDMLRSLRCAPVDVDRLVSERSEVERAAPEVPKSMPNDLVRAPRQY